MKRTLITGTNGFIANRLIDLCGGQVFGISRSDNHKAIPKATTLYGDILDLEFIKRVVADNEIEVIYHLAAQSIVRIANTNPRYAFDVNVMGTVNLLEAVRQINPKIRILIASSDKSYGNHETLPYTEHMALQAGDPYSTSKACADLITQSYAETYGLNVSIIRSANIYGGGDMNLSRIIPNTINKILRNEKPVIYSGVMAFVREFIHVDDVCAAYLLIAEKGEPGEAYNVGTNDVCKVGDMVETICELMDWENGIELVDKAFPEIKLQYLSSNKINSLGWYPKVTMQEGLKKTIDWYSGKIVK